MTKPTYPIFDIPLAEDVITTKLTRNHSTKRYIASIDVAVPIQVAVNQRIVFDGDPSAPMTVAIQQITLLWECERCDVTATQPLSNIADAGTFLCEQCDDEMSLASVAQIDPELLEPLAHVPKRFASAVFSQEERERLAQGEGAHRTDFTAKNGKRFEATVYLNEHGILIPSFPETRHR